VKNLLILIAISFLFNSNCYANNLYEQIYQKINTVRKNQGLPLLVLNDKLMKAAQSQSDWMAKNNRMSHLRPMPSSYEQFRTCNHHPANRIINAGYFEFEELFTVKRNPKGETIVCPKPEANKNLNEIIAEAKAGRKSYDTNIIVSGWLNSPGHRKAMLDPTFKEFGIGITSLKAGEVYWCVVFASR